MSTPTDLTGAERVDVGRRLEWEIARQRSLLRALVEGDGPETVAPVPTPPGAEPTRLDVLAQIFGLTPFERDVVMLTAAIELDAGTADAVRAAGGGVDPRATIGLTLTVLPDAHWDAWSPDAPLRHWQLLTVGEGDTFVNRRLMLDERVLHHLLGLLGVDRRLDGVVLPPYPSTELYPTHSQAAADAGAWLRGDERPALVTFGGSDDPTRSAVAMQIVAELGATPATVLASALPPPGPLLHDTTRLVDREWLLSGRLPVLARTEGHPEEAAAFLAATTVPVVIVLDGEPRAPDRVRRHVALAPPTPEEQRALWSRALPSEYSGALDRVLDEISYRHRLAPDEITSIARELGGPPLDAMCEKLVASSRARSRARLEVLAQRVESAATWEDLVLPPGHLEVLQLLTRQVRHRATVYERWGFASRTSRGLGVTALFSGESGTGKTLAAEVIANDLGLDLHRVDLSGVVSKWIGETEKNLARLFDAAEDSGAVLLFDEADALFGRRTEVRDSHDRYANLEVSYLLQRMESYRGLAILTTNLRANVDRAFLRRIRFVVQFPFPDEGQRASIWRRVFPPDVPLDGVDPEAMSKLIVTGGAIWSIALGAAFAAAERGTPVTPEILRGAAVAEYAKNDRVMTASETEALR